MPFKKILLIIALVLLLFAANEIIPVSFGGASFRGARVWMSNTASVLPFYNRGISAGDIRRDYKEARRFGNRPVKILIVPGHDKSSVGTQYKSLKEIELNLELASELHGFLSEEGLLDVTLVQTSSGYNPLLSRFFDSNRDFIKRFRAENIFKMQKAIADGLVQSNVTIRHNFAPIEISYKLYGINLWSNQKDVDIVIHVHFNDYPGRRRGVPGKYSGFAIYSPEWQYSNADSSWELSEYIKERLNTNFSISDFKKESDGIIPDQELIAVGASNTLDSAVSLIEYGYIYERPFRDPALRTTALKELAYQTYLGVMDLLEGKKVVRASIDSTTLLPYLWERDLKEGLRGDKDVFSLQAALVAEGVYPPSGFSKTRCPVSGSFLSCTIKAVKEFQEKHRIDSTGYVGPQTREVLNSLYSQ